MQITNNTKEIKIQRRYKEPKYDHRQMPTIYIKATSDINVKLQCDDFEKFSKFGKFASGKLFAQVPLIETIKNLLTNRRDRQVTLFCTQRLDILLNCNKILQLDVCCTL